MTRLLRSILLAAVLLGMTLDAPVARGARPITNAPQYMPLIRAEFTAPPVAGTVFGVDFITSAQSLADEHRYAQAARTLASYDRVPFYWWAIETNPGVFDWAAHDAAVAGDITHGYKLDAILLMPPGFYVLGPCPLGPAGQARVGQRVPQAGLGPGQDCTTPQNLNQPIFTDGTDTPGAGKSINPNNYWARYVYLTVMRYKPGGDLAQSLGWGPGLGVRLWEIWNEPDWEFFWNGDAAKFARALKVAYLAIYQADPDAQVMFGGLSNIGVTGYPSGRPSWLNDVLTVIAADPDPALRNQYAWYFDAVGDHNYSDAWSSWNLIYTHNNVVASFGLTGKGSWLNETAAPVCGDYPGPDCQPWIPYRASLTEAASFEIQSATYAMFVGVDGYLHFQLYDECGNPYDAFGIFRNPATHPCNNQSPWPDTPRPTIDAFKVNVNYLWGLEPLWRKRPGGPNPYTGPQEWIAFYRPSTHQRVLAVWARFYNAETANIPATGASALRVDQTGATVTLTPVDGYYTMVLPAATNFNVHGDGSAFIGGVPYILVETDTRPPDVTVTPLPPQSPPNITLTWSGEDLGSGVASYEVWAKVDGGALAPWTTTTLTSTLYTGQSGHTYGFAVRGLDRAGNWGAQPTSVQTSTYVP